MRKKSQPRHPRMLPADPKYVPIIPNDVDKNYRNGLLHINIAALPK